MVVGPLFDSHGSRVLLISGTIIYVLSIMFTSLSSELYHFILAQGVMFGIGDAMLYAAVFFPIANMKAYLTPVSGSTRLYLSYLTGSTTGVALLSGLLLLAPL